MTGRSNFTSSNLGITARRCDSQGHRRTGSSGVTRSIFHRFIFAIGLAAGIAPAFAAPPPPVPALPDAERRIAYSISASTCACSIGFQIYQDGTDVDSWIEVWINGVQYLSTDASHGWSLSSVSPNGLSGARPITNAVLTFNSAQTGTVQIVGAQRPRRLSTFSENQGVAARDLNQVLNGLTAQLRETWDKINDVNGRALVSPPGNSLGPLPSPSTCGGALIGFDVSGFVPKCVTNLGSGNVTLPVTNGHVAVFEGSTGRLKDGGSSRTALSANTTYYVRSDGSDTACTGATNAAYSSGSFPQPCAFATWNNGYLAIAQQIDFNGFTLTLKSGTAGTYTAGLFMNSAWVGGGYLTIDLGGSTIAETVTKGIINNVVQPGPITVQNGTVSSTAFSCIQNAAPGNMYIGTNLIIGTCNEADFEAVNGGNLFGNSNPYTVTGASGASNTAHFFAGYGSTIGFPGATATFGTNRTYNTGFARTAQGGTIVADTWSAVLGGHTITSPRYDSNQGRIYTNNSGATFFPGSSAGTVEGGGCYDTTCGFAAANGGSAPGSGVAISSTASAAPSGDFINVLANTVNIGAIPSGGVTTVNFGSPGAQSATVNYSGSTSGNTGVKAAAIASGTLTLPAGTGTLLYTGNLGTGVLAALAVNVGSAGAPVLLNGALGSPSSAGTMPAFTLGGTVSGGGNQINNVIIGTVTPLAGTFTTLGSGVHTITSSNAACGTVGPNGATNPVLSVDCSTASQVAGLKITGAATGGTVALVATDSGANTSLSIDPKGTTGQIGIATVNAGAGVKIGTGSDASSISGTSLYVTLGGSTAMTIRNSSAHVELFFLASSSQSFFGTSTTHDLVIRSNNTNAVTINGSTQAVTATNAILSTNATAGVGYATGAGGTVTQATSKSTGVTLNTVTGAITMNAAALAATTIVTFVLTDSAIAATDYIGAAHESGGTTGAYTVNCRATGTGTAACDVRNNTAGSLSEAIVIRFFVHKSVNSFLLNRDIDPASNDNTPAFTAKAV